MNTGINIRLLICRTCLQIKMPLHNIFHYFKGYKQISEMLVESTSIKVETDDGLPPNICSSCLEKLSITYDFNAMVTASDIKLHNFYSTCDKEQQINLNIDDLIVKEETTVTSCQIYDENDKKKEDGQISNNVENVNISQINQFETVYGNVSNLEAVEEVIKEENEDRISLQNDCDKSSIHENHDKSSSLSDTSDEDSDKSSSFEDFVSEIGENSAITSGNCEYSGTSDKFSEEDLSLYKKLGSRLNRLEKNSKQIYCKVCKRTFTFLYFLRKHLPQHTGQLSHICKLCNVEFQYSWLLMGHKRKLHGFKPYSCELCDMSFKYQREVPVHMKVHLGEPIYKCPVCTESFQNMLGRKIHLRKHKGAKCNNILPTSEALRNHQLIHKNKKKNKFVCAKCGRSCKTKRKLAEHERTHLKLRPFGCYQCGISFSTKEIFENHMLIHTGEEPYLCKVCGKMFRKKRSLPKHMRIHTGETPFTCEVSEEI